MFEALEIRRGFTTGSCAQAAAKAAAIMLTNRKIIKKVEIETPSGVRLTLNLVEQRLGDYFAECAVVKDAGSDPDVTNGIKIYARVKLIYKKGITITAGEGIGKVTKPGLAIGVGEFAINPVPRKMILKEVFNFLKEGRGFEVIISIPQGEELAKRTYNPRLGIVGGLSVIGTTGIVEPKSLDAYKASLSLELDVLKAQGYKKAALVLGYVGERYCKDILRLKEDSIIKIGDQVGFMLLQCAKKDIADVFLIGHIGKLIKVSDGQFNTHSKFGDNRISLLVKYAKLCGADNKIIEELRSQTTAEGCIEPLRKAYLIKVFKNIACDVSYNATRLVNNRVRIKCVVLSLKGEVLGEHIGGF